MILEVVADSRKIDSGLDADGVEHCAGADARDLKQDRREYGPCSEDHFAAGLDCPPGASRVSSELPWCSACQSVFLPSCYLHCISPRHP